LPKTNDKLVLKAGSYAGEVLDKAGVQALASIPSRERTARQVAGRHAGAGDRFCRALLAPWPSNAKKPPPDRSDRRLATFSFKFPDLGVYVIMAITKEDILEAVGAMTVMELNDLVKAFEEKFGVSAAAMAVAGPAGAVAALPVVEEQTEFTVMLNAG
jgi:hypothetical protein